ncbi:MAG: glycosyltransferase family 2 protein [Saprospiraceae bacterium]|jgi:glycosyltransferase involved in cell wall biosynthesis
MSDVVSIIITVLNEEENVKPLILAIRNAMIGFDFEIIFVDDGSTDLTLTNILENKSEDVVVVEFSKNFGQSLALMAGIHQAKGNLLVTLDGDLQNDPSDIPVLIEKLKAGGYDMVIGNRRNRKDGWWLRKFPSYIANFIIRNLSGVHLKDYGCALKVFTRDLGISLGLYGELHRFIPVLAVLEGAKIVQVDVKHHHRLYGKSKYGLSRIFRVVSDLILMLFYKKYSQKPMHLFGTSGLLLLFVGFVINLYLLIIKIQGNDIWGKPLLILGLLLIISGFQFLTIGIIVEIQMRTYFESQDKKPYRVRNIYD